MYEQNFEPEGSSSIVNEAWVFMFLADILGMVERKIYWGRITHNQMTVDRLSIVHYCTAAATS